MLKNFILETCNAPGITTPINLAGAAAGRMAFSQGFSTGAPCYYFMDDGAQAEWGVGTYTTGVPNTLARATVIGNTAGTTARLNFTGTVRVYNEVPAERMLWADQNLLTTFPGDAALLSVGGGQIAGCRNAVINGAFDIWQRGTSFVTPATASYLADRWRTDYDGTGATVAVARFALTQAAMMDLGFKYGTTYAVTVAGSGATARNFRQRIEGVRTLAAKTVTLSAWLWADAPRTVAVNLTQIFGTGGSPSTAVSLTAQNWSVTTTPTKFTATFALPSIAGKTLGTNGDDFLDLVLSLPINAVMTINMTGVQLEPGPVATPFEWRPAQQEVALCQRYWQAGQLTTTGYAAGAGVSIIASSNFPVAMRAIPTVTPTPVTLTNCGTFTAGPFSNVGAYIQAIATATGGMIAGATYTANAEL